MTIKKLSVYYLLFSSYFLLSAFPLRAHISDDSGDGRQLFGYKTTTAPTIDGTINTAEWQDASVRKIVIARPDGGQATDATLLFKNDGSFLYVGIATIFGSSGAGTYIKLFFDQKSGGGTDHDDQLNDTANLEEYYVHLTRDNTTKKDGGYSTGSTWTENASAAAGLEMNCALGGGSVYNWEFKIPLNGGTPGANGYLTNISTTGELGFFIEGRDTAGGPVKEYYWTILPSTSLASASGWADLKLGIDTPDRLISALYEPNANKLPTVTDGNIATDTGWNNGYSKSIVLTNFSTGTLLATKSVEIYLKDDSGNIYFGIQVPGAGANDFVQLYMDYDVGGVAPRSQDYELEAANPAENGAVIGPSGYADMYFNGAGAWAGDAANGSGACGVSGSGRGYEVIFPKAGTGNGDLQIGNLGKIGFLIKYVDVTNGTTYWWNRFSNNDYFTSTAANYLAIGWVSLQCGGPYFQTVFPDAGTMLGGGIYPLEAYAVPFPGTTISSVSWRTEDYNTGQGVSPYSSYEQLTQIATSYWWVGNIDPRELTDRTTYSIMFRCVDSSSVETKKPVTIYVVNDSSSGVAAPSAALIINTPANGEIVKGQKTISFQVTPQTTLVTNNSLISIDGSTFTYAGITQPAPGGGNGSYVFYSTNVAAGAHIFRVKALDSNGTTGYSETRLIIVDNTAPAVTPADVSYLDSNMELKDYSFARNGDKVILGAKAEDYTSGISTVVMNASSIGAALINLLDNGITGGQFDPTAGDGVYSSSMTINSSALGGMLTYYFFGTDSAGNTSNAITGWIQVDNSTPVLSIAAPLGAIISSSTAGGSVVVTYSYTEENPLSISVELYDGTGIIGSRYESAASTFAVNRADSIAVSGGAAAGLKSLRITVTDKAGNFITKTETDCILIDNTKPLAQVGAPLGGSIINDNTPLITALFYETGSGINTATCLVRVDGSTVPAIVTGSSVTYQAGILNDGAHAVSIDVRDIAGNQADILVWNFTVDTIAPQTVSIGRITPSYYSAASSVTYIKGTIEVEAVAGDGVYLSSVTFYDDSGAKGIDTTTSYTFSWAPAEGERTIYVLAYDSMSNVSQSRTVNVVCDNTVPVVQVLAPLAASKQSSRANNNVAVRYQYTESNPSSVLIRIYNNAGTEVGRKELTTGLTGGSVDRWDNVEIISTAGEGTDYDVYVQVTDRVNQSANDTEADVVIIDNTVPVITVNAPAGGSIISNNRPTIRADYSDSGGSGINTGSVKFLIDGVDFSGLSDVAATYVSTVPINALSEGVHTVLVEVSDNSGNKASQVSWGFTVDTTRPQTVSVGRITPAYYVQGSSITYIKGTIWVEAIAGDGVNLSSVTFYDDSGAKGVDNTSPYTFSWAPAEGERSIYIVAYDSMSNVTQSGTVNVICDNTAPAKANIFYPATNSFVKGVTGIKYDFSDIYGVSRVELYDNSVLSGEQKYSVKNSTGEFVYDSRAVSAGVHTLKITAYDNTGNSLDSSNVAITIDNEIPQVMISGLSNPTSGQSLVTYITTETVTALVKAELYVDGGLEETNTGNPVTTGINTFTWNTTKFEDGSHSLMIKVYDRSGNTGESVGRATTVDNLTPQSNVLAVLTPNYRVAGSTLTYIKGNVKLEASVSDSVLISYVTFYYDAGKAIPPNPMDSSEIDGWKADWDVSSVLLDGHHTAYCVAVDTMNNILRSRDISFVIDNTTPVVTINTVTTQTKYPNQLVTGSYDEVNTAYLKVNGIDVNFISTSTWRINIALVRGTNTVSAVILDAAGNSARAETAIFYDPDAPIQILRPDPYSMISGTITIEVIAPDITTDVTFQISPDGLNWYNLEGTLNGPTTDSYKSDGWKKFLNTKIFQDVDMYQIKVKAYNNETTPWTLIASDVIVNLTLDNTAPKVYYIDSSTASVQYVEITPGDLSRSTATFTYLPRPELINGTTKEIYTNTLQIKFVVRDEISGVQSARLKSEGYYSPVPNSIIWGMLFYNDLIPEISSGEVVQYIPLAEGKNRITLTCIDKLGNETTTYTDTIYYVVPKESKIIEPVAGGTVQSPDGTKVEIKENILLETMQISIIVVDRTELIKPTDPNLKLTPVAREFGPSGTVFNQPVTITIPFTETDLDSNMDGIVDKTEEFNRDKLEIYYWNGAYWLRVGAKERNWDELNKKGYITADVNHFSVYALAQNLGPAAEKFDVYLTRNPFLTGIGTAFRFDLVKRARIRLKIYDLAGDIVYKYPWPGEWTGYYNPGQDGIDWRGDNQFGNYIGTGIYIYLFEVDYEDGSPKEIKKDTIGVVK